MKAFRELVIKSDEEHHKLILNAIDFYSTSMFRDLLFHVQEHRFTIPRIRDYLDELGLFFCGFESAPIVESFTRINGASDALYDLQKWEVYENDNPRTFAGMYQFWCQKIS